MNTASLTTTSSVVARCFRIGSTYFISSAENTSFRWYTSFASSVRASSSFSGHQSILESASNDNTVEERDQRINRLVPPQLLRNVNDLSYVLQFLFNII